MGNGFKYLQVSIPYERGRCHISLRVSRRHLHLDFLKQAFFVLGSFVRLCLCLRLYFSLCSCLRLYFSLCLCFYFSSRLNVLVEVLRVEAVRVEVVRVEEVGSSKEASSSRKVSLSEEVGRLVVYGGWKASRVGG